MCVPACDRFCWKPACTPGHDNNLSTIWDVSSATLKALHRLLITVDSTSRSKAYTIPACVLRSKQTGLVLRYFLELQIARTGDIVALGGLKDVITGETLCDEKAPIMLERMEFPDPVIKVPHHRTSATTHAVSMYCRFSLDMWVFWLIGHIPV